jgi:23S rRNA pseudouridine2605 synthase
MKSKVKSEVAKKAPTARRVKMSVATLEKPRAKRKASGKNATKAKAETKAQSVKTTDRSKTAKTSLKAEPPVDIAVRTARNRAKTGESAPKAKEETAKPAGAKRRKKEPKLVEGAHSYRIGEAVVDPVGDTTDGEGRTYLGESGADTQANAEAEEFRKDTRIEASDAILEAGPGMQGAAEAAESDARRWAQDAAARGAGEEAREEAEQDQEHRGPVKLERLQKILSQAGIASRRRAEEMITAGRVMVNGQVVTTLGSKADPARDHIRVDGKMLHGAERHRYFVLNKPRGYVTTVSDPEGRPTVMKFFEKMHERLYPVGRLDYQSEGLLLMTNDGELANLLTKAGSGVEKTYLVKVAGQPSEQELERLRSGVTIERAEEGSGRVRTAPARVRQVRVGDNPWFEVVLIEGRNRELRKMFAAVGHFVEKIRRVSYGPLTLDVEPGKLRELTPDEITALRMTAEGKMKPRHVNADRMLPVDAGRTAEKRAEKRGGYRGREFGRRTSGGFEKKSGDFGSGERGGLKKREDRGFDRGNRGGFEKRERKDFGRRAGGEFRQSDGVDFGRRGAGGFGRRESKPFRQGESTNRGGGFGVRREGTFQGQNSRFNKPKFGRQGFGGGPRRESESRDFGARDRKPFRERGEREFRGDKREPFRAHGERPYFKRGGEPKGRFDGAPAQRSERGGGKGWGARPESRRDTGPRGESRGPREAAPEFRGQGRKFGGGKGRARSGGRPGGFSEPRRESGRGGRAGGGRGFGGRKRR